MCLTIDTKQSQKYKTDSTATVTVYKVLMVTTTPERPCGGGTCQLSLRSPHYCLEWTPGQVKSSARSKGKSSFRNRFVEKGIHVFTTKKMAKEYHKEFLDITLASDLQQPVVVKLEAKMTDFLGCDAYYHAVFTNVTLSQKEYDKALKKALKSGNFLLGKQESN